ncbi:hypothetical protein KQ51_00993 [Candidatus Izimaplasma bacterium HR1]|jgi:multiple sugar transport system substrate-binding protein|uniref:hypothetical protein n=1 Tax=Candidatus Izimoplasma sp. HR1 TaxID=1541959 RepID=UPI0004F65A71|nr:hypothetical protein KQ51_00993 [Candidatus Izimaplasma bacterium HR1]
MKRIALLFATLIFVLTLAACGGETVQPTPPTIAGISDGGTIEVKVGTIALDLASITATDDEGNSVDVTINGNFNLNEVGEYDVVLSATDGDGLRVAFNVTVRVVALTCEEDPTQEICKTPLDLAREEFEGTIYNVDEDSNGVADWEEDTIELSMGWSYYEIEGTDNPVWSSIQKFMEVYPNITVTRDERFTTGWEDGDNGLLLLQESALLEGSLPDIYFNPKAAETYDKGMTLDLNPYIRTDEEAQMITPNALAGMMTYDNREMWGIPWQGVGPLVVVNTSLLAEYGLTAPGYDWTYAEYEALRAVLGNLNTNDECVFPGVIDFSLFGANYFDGVPGGYKGYNIETQRFDFASATNYGTWLQTVATEAISGWHFYDLEETAREEKCPGIADSWVGGKRAINTMYLYEFNAKVNEMVSRGFDIDIYPYPEAPTGGETATFTYHDYYSMSKLLEADRVKAEAAFQLIKWLTFGEEGLQARWDLIDELNVPDGEGNSPFVNGDLYLMNYVQGWPITSNPDALANHPLVKGFATDSGGLDIFNFAAFQIEDFQYQLSNANPYPRQIPAFASVANEFDPWDIKDKMRDESLSWGDVWLEYETDLNDQIVDFLQYYYTVGDDE